MNNPSLLNMRDWFPGMIGRNQWVSNYAEYYNPIVQCESLGEKRGNINVITVFLLHSDGLQAKRFTHLFEEKSTCSSASSNSQMAGSAPSSSVSKTNSDSTHSSSLLPCTTSISSPILRGKMDNDLVSESPEPNSHDVKELNNEDSKVRRS